MFLEDHFCKSSHIIITAQKVVWYSDLNMTKMLHNVVQFCFDGIKSCETTISVCVHSTCVVYCTTFYPRNCDPVTFMTTSCVVLTVMTYVIWSILE